MMGSGGVRGMSRTLRGSIRGLTGLFLLVVSLAPSGLSAQMEASDASGSDFELFASIGVLTPIANLTENPGSFGTVITPNALFGLEATMWASDAIGIGVLGMYAPVELDAFATQFMGAVPENLGSVDFAAAMANLTFRLRSSGSASTLEPYFSIGGGIRHLSVDEIAAPEAETSTDPAVTIAGGIRVLVADGVWIRGELRDIASRYTSPATGEAIFQNDFAVSFGLGFSP